MSSSSLEEDSVQKQSNSSTIIRAAADSIKYENHSNNNLNVNDEINKSDITTTKIKRKYSIGKFPEGYRFCPHDYELIIHYLKNKVNDQPLPHDNIKDVDLYKFNPFDLAAQYPRLGDIEWYFFSPRDRKYANGDRPNRRAGDGYWKATGSEKAINYGGMKVGFERALVFYIGKPPKGDKTTWIMHEYRMNQPPRPKTYAKDMRLNDWVLCKIYEQGRGKSKHKKQEPAGETKKRNCAMEIGSDEHDHMGSMNADISGGNESSDSQTLQLQEFYNHPTEDMFMQLDHDLQNWEMIKDDESLDIHYLTFSASPPDSIDSILDEPSYSRTPST